MVKVENKQPNIKVAIITYCAVSTNLFSAETRMQRAIYPTGGVFRCGHTRRTRSITIGIITQKNTISALQRKADVIYRISQLSFWVSM